MNLQRVQKLQKNIRHPILIKKKENLFYLTGRSFDYRAEEYLLVTKKEIVAFGSGLENIDWVKKSDRLKNIGQYLEGNKKLDIEYGFTYGEGEYLKLKVKSVKCKVKPERSAVDILRQLKTDDEIAKIKKSMQIVGQVFSLVRKEIKKRGMTEKGLADFITKMGYKMGAEDISFPAIVVSGSRAAIPHHVPGNKKLKPGESVIIDFGFKYKHYCSDFTRTVFLKKVPKRLAEAYDQVEKAYNGSIWYIDSSLRGVVATKQSIARNRLLRPKGPAMTKARCITAGQLYQKSVDILAEKKLDKYFIHSLGHGTGLEIHELPNLSPNSKDELKDGMVFSIEPGVYFPKLGGIRIEDLVYLKNGKVEKFINVPTKLEENIF